MFAPPHTFPPGLSCPLASPEIIAGHVKTGILLLCDHAANAVPAGLSQLGMSPEQMERHIAYDIGAADMTRAMAAALGAPAILTRFSRLLIDPNRGREDPTLVMRLSDGALVPGNARLSETQISERRTRYYDPYDAAINVATDTAVAAGFPPAIISIHSFTPHWKGVPRPWHVGVLWDCDVRLARLLIETLTAEGDVIVGDNEPYFGGLPGDTIDRHATARGLLNALIEVRQDLISERETAHAWGMKLADVLRHVMQHSVQSVAAR